MNAIPLTALRVGSADRVFKKILQLVFLLAVVGFFLKLGSDTLEYPELRLVYLSFLGVNFLSLTPRLKVSDYWQSPTVVFFLVFFSFELVRFSWAGWQIWGRGLEDSVMLPLHRYLASPVTWLIYLGFFLLSFSLFGGRTESRRLLKTLMGSAFLLAVFAIPPLLIKAHTGYVAANGQGGFFPPFFYFHPLVGKYFLSRYAHPNYVGDIVAMGFFPALGTFFYSLRSLRDQRVPLISLVLPGLFTATTGLAIILFFSRATIVCFAAAFLLFLLATLIKYPSRIQLLFALLAFALVLAFLLWAGNIQKTVAEVETLKKETDTTQQNTTGSLNREGTRRSLGIYQTFTTWGVGTRGYESVSELYSSDRTKPSGMAQFKAFNHYFQTLAEEGTGAFLYFFFLLSYFLESGWRPWKAKSRFQFMAGLSLVTPVLLILAHAAVAPGMDYFAMAAPVYILMGATLAILQGNFARA